MQLENKIIFIGSFVANDDSRSHNNFSQAAILFQKKFVDFVQPDLTISILPIFYSKKSNFSYHKNVKFINNQSGLKNKWNYLYRLIFDTIEVTNCVRKSSIENVFFYNIDYQNATIILLCKILFKKRIYLIVADYQYYRKKIIDSIFNYIIGKVNGVIILNSNIICNRNSKLLLGILYDNQILTHNSESLNRNVILSGSLGKTTGLELALDFFSHNPEYSLYVTGKPFRYIQDEFDELIKLYSQFKNIHFLGLLEYQDYIELLTKCDIALSLRDPGDFEHLYNFPSKILEYLSNSKIVISTMEYPDLPDGTLFYSKFDPISLKETIESIYDLESDEISLLQKKNHDYLKANMTGEQLVKIVNELIANN